MALERRSRAWLANRATNGYFCLELVTAPIGDEGLLYADADLIHFAEVAPVMFRDAIPAPMLTAIRSRVARAPRARRPCAALGRLAALHEAVRRPLARLVEGAAGAPVADAGAGAGSLAGAGLRQARARREVAALGQVPLENI